MELGSGMKKLTVYMQERVFYSLLLEVPDDATDDDIEALARERFDDGHYRIAGCANRSVDNWKEST
jgi:hypothetical protein